MLINSNQQQTVVYVKTSKGQFGPYPSRSYAESMLRDGLIPKESSEVAQIVERLDDGREMLLG
jgi:hypothetical protein